MDMAGLYVETKNCILDEPFGHFSSNEQGLQEKSFQAEQNPFSGSRVAKSF